MTLEIKSIEETILPILNNKFEIVKIDNQYQITNYQNLKDMFDFMKQQALSYQMSEEDRTHIRNFKSKVNKAQAHIKQEIKDLEAKEFGLLYSQQKSLMTSMTNLGSVLSKGLDAMDLIAKEQKRDEIKKMFEDAKSHIKEISQTDLSLEDVLDARWLNRSTPISNVVNQMNERLTSIRDVYVNPLVENISFEDIVESLEDHDWNGLSALTNLASRGVVNEGIEDKQASHSSKVLIEISHDDLEKATRALNTLGVKHRVV